MRKFFATFALLFVLSISVFADGEISLGGGRACPEAEPDQPPPPCVTTTPPASGQSNSNATGAEEETDEPTVLDDVIDYLNSLFG